MEVINIQYNGIGKQSQTYSVVDTTLITDNFINSIFGDTNDYIEFFITDESGQILDYLYDSKNYTLTSEIGSGANQYSSILIDPEKDVKSRGFDRGRTIVQYNFFKRLFNSNLSNKYWIKEISTSRLELKLSSQTISGDSMNSGFNQFQSYIAQKNYYGDFYLNFGNNNLVIAVNAAYVNDNGESYILIKLYEQLPLDFDLKSELWIVDKLAESTSFLVDIQVESEVVIEEFKLRGPNYSVQTSDKAGQTTPYYSYQSLFSSPISSSTQQLLSYYDDKAISINVNYASFDNFIHFSSAAERINNFAYKVGLIETYNTQIAAQSSIIGNQSITSASIQTIKSNINNIIEKFDGYEYYLYYTSGAFAWPKSTKTTPYSLYSVTSSQALSWLGSENTLPTATSLSILYSASLYDNTNKDILRTSVPQYLLDDPSNQPYVTFMDMIGQHFDNIWIYYKDVTNRFNATNNPDTGISLDLVADAIRSLGIQLYTNTNLSDNVFYSLFGYNQDGSLLPPTGSEGSAAYPIRYVTSSISGSGVAYTLPYDQIQKEIYKRIYHNLPYLLKTRGTERGVKALIACYGIPDSILTINEFGGYDRYSQIGIEEIYNNKITVISGSNELSESLLSRYSTLQRYDRDNRKNSLNIEVGFSPANTINQNISASLGYFAIDNLIGNPRDQYSSSYQSLVSASNSYFSTYTKPHSIWEYIRLIKFYNNSLFKMIKDFAPARSSVSSGIIIKPHVLERSKYKRNEPQPIFQNNYSQSIDMVSINGSHATSYEIDSTTYKSSPSLIGYIPITSSFGFEKYTGEFEGTEIIATSLTSLGNQTEISSNAITGSFINLDALFQNVTASVRSQKYLDLDYGYNANVPVNFGIITQSIDNSQIDNYSTYTNKNNPYAELQDYNYFAQRSTIPRYYGSSISSATYNNYTIGDISYGNTATIDKIKYQYAYLINIYTSSLFLPQRSDSQIKYLIDNDSNVLNLNKSNPNIFEIQNIFKSGEIGQIALFDYSPTNPEVQLLTNNTTLGIYEGGFRYVPIMYSSASVTYQGFYLNTAQEVTITGGSTVTPDQLDPANFSLSWVTYRSQASTNAAVKLRVTASNNGAVINEDVTLNVNFHFVYDDGSQIYETSDFSQNIIISASNSQAKITYSDVAIQIVPTDGPTFWLGPTATLSIASVTAGTGTTTSGSAYTYYTTYVTSSQPCVYYLTGSNQLVLNNTVAQYYNYGLTCDPLPSGFNGKTGVEKIILPFNPTLGDKVCLYNSSSLGWDERFEYTILNTSIIGQGTGSRFLITLDKPANLALFSSGSVPVDAATGTPYRNCTYAILKHQPDETNLILRYNPKTPVTQDGLVYPQYLDRAIKENSGNIIKSLKSDNLI